MADLPPKADAPKTLDPVPVDVLTLDQREKPAAVLGTCMQKGGVGKTETTKGLGDQLSKIERPDGTKVRVLFVDMDPNGTLSDGVGIKDDPGLDGIATLILDKPGRPINELVYAVTDSLHIIPARDDMFVLNDELVGKRGRERRLWKVIQPLLPYYDAIIFDCESDLGPGTDNVLYAVSQSGRGGIIVVVELEGPSMRTFEILLDQVEALENELDVTVPFLGWFGNATGGTKINQKYRELFEALPLPKLGEMPTRTKIKEAWDLDLLLSDYMSPSYDGNFVYRELATSVWGHIQ